MDGWMAGWMDRNIICFEKQHNGNAKNQASSGCWLSQQFKKRPENRICEAFLHSTRQIYRHWVKKAG